MKLRGIWSWGTKEDGSFCFVEVVQRIFFLSMRLLQYLVFLFLYLYFVDAGTNEAGKKGPKVTHKVRLALLHLCTSLSLKSAFNISWKFTSNLAVTSLRMYFRF
jgi:hypothetical protein